MPAIFLNGSKNIKMKILYLGSLGFPHGSASVNRRFQLANIFINNGYKIFVLLRRGSHNFKTCNKLDIKTYQNIKKNLKYFHSSLIYFRPSNFLVRNIFKCIGYVVEIFSIIYLRIFRNYKIFLCDSIYISDIYYYSFLSKILNAKFIYDYVEYVDSLNYRNEILMDNIPKKFDNNMYNLVDEIICISENLQSLVLSQHPQKKTYLLPPTFDFIDYNGSVNRKNQILCCTSTAYLKNINFIIESFLNSNFKKNNFKLHLIVSGDSKIINDLLGYIRKDSLDEHIKISSNIKYETLLKEYASSYSFILHLTNAIQDCFRFPFKICEYAYFEKPLITTNNGPIPNLFQNNISCILYDSSIHDLTSKLNYVYLNEKKVETIGLNSKKEFYDYNIKKIELFNKLFLSNNENLSHNK